MIVPRIMVACLALAALFNAPGASAAPNIIFILADDLGWADVGYTAGDQFYETPHIDRMAKEGLVFENGYAGGPNCAPMRACFVSGMYTPRHKIYTPGGTCRGNPFKQKLWVPLREGSIRKGIPDSECPPDPFPVTTRLEPSAFANLRSRSATPSPVTSTG